MTINLQSLQSLASGLPPDVLGKLRSALAAQDGMNQQLALPVNSPFTTFTPTLANGWLAVAPERAPLVQQFSNGLVVVSGSVKNGTVAADDTGTVFVLPVGMRSRFDFQNFATWTFDLTAGALLGRVELFTNGNVRAAEGGNIEFALSFCFIPGN